MGGVRGGWKKWASPPAFTCQKSGVRMRPLPFDELQIFDKGEEGV
jgi:hypothetical protein